MAKRTSKAAGAAVAERTKSRASPVEYVRAPIGRVSVWTYNHRDPSRVGNLESLAASLRAQGMIEPMLARRIDDGGFEVVAGSRRLGAAKLAGLDEVPLAVRDLDDREAIECQLAENLERLDPDPFDTADAFKLLRERYKLSAAEIAERFPAMSESAVAKSLRLAACTDVVRMRYRAQEITIGAIREFLVLPDAVAIEKAVADFVLSLPANPSSPLSAGEARRWVLSNALLDLARVPWDLTDSKLCAEAGACAACPKRMANQRDLFGDIAAEDARDLCTDAACFREKMDATYGVAVESARAIGAKILEGAASASKVSEWGHVKDPKLVGLDAKCECEGHERKTWRQALRAAVGLKSDATDGDLAEKADLGALVLLRSPTVGLPVLCASRARATRVINGPDQREGSPGFEDVSSNSSAASRRTDADEDRIALEKRLSAALSRFDALGFETWAVVAGVFATRCAIARAPEEARKSLLRRRGVALDGRTSREVLLAMVDGMVESNANGVVEAVRLGVELSAGELAVDPEDSPLAVLEESIDELRAKRPAPLAKRGRKAKGRGKRRGKA